MATHGDRDRGGRMEAGQQAFGREVRRDPSRISYKRSHCSSNGKPEQAAADSDGSEGGGATNAVVSFSTNHNSVVCLPLVSEGLKLVWTQSDQTRELDCIPELVQAFNVFPYPTSREVAALARGCALPLDKVKVWFMVQRIKYGISWASEEIEETRRKLAGPERCLGGERAEEVEERGGEHGRDELGPEDEQDDSDSGVVERPLPIKRPKLEVPEPPRPRPVPHFRSSLPPPQDSYYYRPPADALSPLEASPSSQRRHGRYKKSKAQLAVLRSSFLRENWPAEAELRRLQEETGLSRNDIRKWFSDSRYQLRNGRGGAGVAQALSPSRGGKNGHQLHPLPLIAHGPRHQQGGAARGGVRGRAVRSNGAGDDRFFENFLSSSLEAVKEGQATREEEENEEEEEEEVLSFEHTAEVEEEEEEEEKEEESEEEQPLQLISTRSDPETQHPPLAAAAASSPSPSPVTAASPSPASATLPHKRTAAGAPSHKPARSSKASPSLFSSPSPSVTTCSSPSVTTSSSSSSSSPVLTAAGRPRKTKEQLDVLKQHFLRCQWPKSEDYTQLVALTGLPRADVIQWFGDTRYAVKNGQLRWVRGVREQFMAELAQQREGGGANGGGASRGGGRRRKLQENGEAADSREPGSAGNSGTDVHPLEVYRRQTGALQEKDLDALCRKSRMSYQQVRDWFASQESGASDVEVNVTD